ncbi:MAG: CGGC domain-containing protein [Desulfobulbaceae bacterium]|nr:CGGC domain-containing protein [Desulfobulbaceae bacterium]
MARIAILTCSNCTQESNCASVVCLGDMRKRKGFFERYKNEDKVDLIGIISCSGCPTLAAPEKILKRVRALANYRINALHFSFCMTALCPFVKKYQKIIQEAYPELTIVLGTHTPKDREAFRRDMKELLCPTVHKVQDMNDVIIGNLRRTDEQKG